MRENPYRSPADDLPLASQPSEGKLVARGWLYRKIEVPAPINATIEYNGRGLGYESVSVNGNG